MRCSRPRRDEKSECHQSERVSDASSALGSSPLVCSGLVSVRLVRLAVSSIKKEKKAEEDLQRQRQRRMKEREMGTSKDRARLAS